MWNLTHHFAEEHSEMKSFGGNRDGESLVLDLLTNHPGFMHNLNKTRDTLSRLVLRTVSNTMEAGEKFV